MLHCSKCKVLLEYLLVIENDEYYILLKCRLKINYLSNPTLLPFYQEMDSKKTIPTTRSDRIQATNNRLKAIHQIYDSFVNFATNTNGVVWHKLYIFKRFKNWRSLCLNFSTYI